MNRLYQPVTRILLDRHGKEVGGRKEFHYFFGGGLFLKQSCGATKKRTSSSRIQSPSSMFHYIGCEEAYFFKRFENDDDTTFGKVSKLLCPTRLLSAQSVTTANSAEIASRISCTTYFRRRNPAISFDSNILERRSMLFPGPEVKKECVQKIIFVFEEDAWKQASHFHQSIALLCMFVESVSLRDCWTRHWPGASDRETQSGFHDSEYNYRAEVCFRIDLDRFEETVGKPQARCMWYGIVCKRFGPFRFTARSTFSRCPDLFETIYLSEQQKVQHDQLEKVTRLVHMIHNAQVNSEFGGAAGRDERCCKCKPHTTAVTGSTFPQRTVHCIHSAADLAGKIAVLFDLHCKEASHSFFTVFADKLGLLTGTYFLQLSLAGQRSCFKRMKDRVRNATRRSKRSSHDAAVERGKNSNRKRSKTIALSLCESMLPGPSDSSVLADLYEMFTNELEGSLDARHSPSVEYSESVFSTFLTEGECLGCSDAPSTFHGFSPTQY